MGIVVSINGAKIAESIHLECPECGGSSFKLCGTSDGDQGWLLQWAQCHECNYKMDFMKEETELVGVNADDI
jgi:hypothetical protein